MQVTFTEDKCIIQFNNGMVIRMGEKGAVELAETILEHYDQKMVNAIDNGLLEGSHTNDELKKEE